ncbi:MAG: hypothetical protein E6J34_06425 [Chloroflexi bacterium]|nr:MAG: hypothetical protein E6J34_06425 [Chloroflexota bacterium]
MLSASYSFSRHLIPGKILVIWDNASIHRCNVVKDWLTKGGNKRIHIERLPAYAPELNPQEGVWNLLKRVELKNVCFFQLLLFLRFTSRNKLVVPSVENSHNG